MTQPSLTSYFSTRKGSINRNWLARGLVVAVLVFSSLLIYLLAITPGQAPAHAAAVPPIAPTPTRSGLKPEPPHVVPLYSDDFSDPDSGWSESADENRERRYQEGEFVIDILHDNWSTWVWGTRQSFADFTLEADARLVNGPHTARLGLIFRQQDNDNFYYFYISDEGKYRVGKRQDGEWASVADLKWKSSSRIQTGGIINHLKVVCVGEWCSFYANGEHLVSVQDESFEAGKIGLIAEAVQGSDPIRVGFDNVQVYGSELQPEPPHNMLMYSDDFNDPDSGWGESADENRERRYQDGEFLIAIKSDDWATWTRGTEQSFADFTLEADARLVDGPDTARFGLVFRQQDNDNFYYFYISGEGKYRVGRQQDGEWASVADLKWTASPHIQTGGITNHLKVVCVGEWCSFYVNGEHLISIQDENFEAGKIGLIAETAPGVDPFQVAFDNLRLYGSELQPRSPHDILLYSDDFSDPNSGWKEVADENRERSYHDGEFRISFKRDGKSTWTYSDEQSFADFTLEADARLVDGSETGHFGLIFRHQDNDNFYYFYISGEGKYRVGKQQDGEWASVADLKWTASPHIQTDGLTNHLKVVCAGDRCAFYANEEHLVSVQDGSFGSGKIGMIAEAVRGSGPIQVAFDNLEVHVPEAEIAAQMIAKAKAGPPMFGPGEGSLAHIVDGSVEAQRAGVDLRDFVVEALFYNPYPATEGDWDIGFLFRDAGSNDEYRINVRSSGEWSINDRRGEEDNFVDQGRVSHLNLEASDSNLLTLLALGERGFLFLNEVFVAQFDLSDRTNSGDIAAASGIADDHEIEGETTSFENFKIWSLSDQAWPGSRPTATPTPRPTAPPVATAPPVQRPSSLNRIAFVSDRHGNQEIYVMNADGSGLTRLTDNPAEDNSPVWSPDGKYIAFVSTRDGNSEIYVMRADGSQQKNLSNNPAPDYDPTWSPDGKYIAFTSTRDDPVKTDIWLMNANGSNQAKLRDFGVSPAWSPDGNQIAAIFRFGGLLHLGVMPADGSAEPKPLIQLDISNFPAWSPDGERIAFESADSPGDSEILVINADGSNLINLTNNQDIIDSYPTWSPDGSRIAFVSDRHGNSEIYIINADGSGLTRLTDNSSWDAYPSWSP
jgi:Tol biopolymer transport system component